MILELEKNQRVFKYGDEVVLENYYPKNEKQTIIKQPKLKPPDFRSCKQNNWIEFNEGRYCPICQIINFNERHHIDKKVLRQDTFFIHDYLMLLRKEKFILKR